MKRFPRRRAAGGGGRAAGGARERKRDTATSVHDPFVTSSRADVISGTRTDDLLGTLEGIPGIYHVFVHVANTHDGYGIVLEVQLLAAFRINLFNYPMMTQKRGVCLTAAQGPGDEFEMESQIRGVC
ncbi:hypothetical protein EVAR_29355_1 [Eumeta japonica]|uniref:Uncharacterized protein n=1 Tax=Eumeta variegata TaxID=151549 RepID=A0A4C1WGN6_EUMVA|nr:hypothetical protein EVAR_29355_1 [Eumeta japonica]